MLRRIWTVFGLLAVIACPVRGADREPIRRIYVPTPKEAAEKMLELAKVSREDVVVQPGCTNGSILIAAAKKYGCKARGCEDTAEWVEIAQANVKKQDVAANVTIEQKDLRDFDYKGATVVCLYLPPANLNTLWPALAKLPKGTRIVTHDYTPFDYRPDSIVEFQGPNRKHFLYVWTVPLKEK